MAIWALSDLHLCLGTPSKSMEIFGPCWKNYVENIQNKWIETVKEQDLVLIAGDISWAMKPEIAKIDLDWIHKLPGTKLMIKGNHDYWWGSATKVRAILPPSIHILSNDSFNWEGVSIAGARLWDTSEYRFPEVEVVCSDEDEAIYNRELQRLESSLKTMTGSVKLAMTHYPPIGPCGQPSRASKLLEQYGVSICIFGHLHALEPGKPYFLPVGSIQYLLTSCDYLNFEPKRIF
jgi:predicted phosphohydrolase